jgi:hypothetical protein
MPRKNSDTSSDWDQRQRALSRWDNEGGAGPDGRAADLALETERTAIPDLTNAELITLRIRVIALENLMICLLATASNDQLRLARDDHRPFRPMDPPPWTYHNAGHRSSEKASRLSSCCRSCALS